MWNILQDKSHARTQNFDKFKKIEIISIIFSNHNTVRVEMNCKKKKIGKKKKRKKENKHRKDKQYATKQPID